MAGSKGEDSVAGDAEGEQEEKDGYKRERSVHGMK